MRNEAENNTQKKEIPDTLNIKGKKNLRGKGMQNINTYSFDI